LGSTQQPKRLPEGVSALMEEEIIHFLMMLKYRQKALLSDPLPCISHGCSQGTVMPRVLNAFSTSWMRGMLFPKPGNFTVLGFFRFSLGCTVPATLWGQSRGWKTFGHVPDSQILWSMGGCPKSRVFSIPKPKPPRLA